MEGRLDIIYLSREQVLDTYSKTIKYSGGGVSSGARLELLDDILGHVHNDLEYPSFEEKLGYLIYAINRSHIFDDGNKRLSITIGALFMLQNGYMSSVNRYMSEMANISNHLATGDIDGELFLEMICSILNGEPDYEEGLKLRYLEAISEGGIGMSVDKSENKLEIEPVDKKKVVFISYCWEDEVHTAWVKQLAEDLSHYFKIRLDQKLPLGFELNKFMEQSVAKADKVLIIATPEYKDRADNRKRGVGYETSLITDDLVNDQNRIKFIPIIRKGTKETSFPRYLGSRKGLDMTKDEGYLEQLDELVRNLLEY